MDRRASEQQQSEPLFGSDGSAPPSQDASRNPSFEHLPALAKGHHSGPAELQSYDNSADSSASHTRTHSPDARPPREKPRVRFGQGSAASSQHDPVSTTYARPKKSNITHARSAAGSGASTPRLGSGSDSGNVSPNSAPPEKAAPSTRRILASNASADVTQRSPTLAVPEVSSPRRWSGSFSLGGDASEDIGDEPLSSHAVGQMAAQTARTRAELLSQSLDPNRKVRSAPGSRVPSPMASPPQSPELNGHAPALPKDFTDIIPLERIEQEKRSRKFGIDDSDSEDEPRKHRKQSNLKRIRAAAKRLVSTHATSGSNAFRIKRSNSLLSSGQTTPDREKDDYYVSKPEQYRTGVLGALLNLYGEDSGSPPLASGQNTPRGHFSKDLRGEPIPKLETPGASPKGSPSSSGHNTPKRKIPKWHERNSWGGTSTSSLSSLINSSTALGTTGVATGAGPALRPRQGSGTVEGPTGRKKSHKGEVAVQIRLHVEDVLARQEYLIKCCRALMKYGAPTHRLEEYMKRSARALEIDGQFLYIPGCMMISFDDPASHTTQVKLVRETQGVDLGKLVYMHDVYKAVVHDKMGVHEASDALDELMAKKPRFRKSILIVVYGLASATVGPFAFGARPIDMPIAFVLGCLLGFMQLVITTKSESYLNVFEISAAVITSFLARAFGSIYVDGQPLFCFPALAQSAIALILPGYMVLGAALELQSRNIVAGSVRMVYAIIYSLFLGFGITIGTSFYGAADQHASQQTSCSGSALPPYVKFAFVPLFTFCLTIINQARWRQIPVMLGIAFAGYVTNNFAAKRFAGNAQVANTLGALAVGVLGNIYSRLFQGMSAAAILPAIFVQVPSGLAASGSLISGIASANQILSNNSNAGITTSANGTQAGTTGIDVNNTVFNVAFSMIQIAVGLTVGLFLSSLIVYPLGKKRSGLFSF